MNSRFYAQAEAFVEIVRQGSMTGAAAALRLSKSNVSQKLSEMEADLDVVLLGRNTRAIELTQAGQRVFDLCVKAIDALHLARGEVKHELQSAAPQGRVTISGSNLYLSEFIMPLLPELRARLPRVQVELMGGDKPVDQRADGVDLRIRVGATDTDGMKTYPLPPLERVLCGHKDLPIGDPRPGNPGDLDELPLILRSQEAPDWVFRKGGKTETYSVRNSALQVNSYELCVSAVRAGLGAAIVAEAVIQKDMDGGSVVEFLSDWKIEPIPVSLVVPISRLSRPEVMAVAQGIVGSL